MKTSLIFVAAAVAVADAFSSSRSAFVGRTMPSVGAMGGLRMDMESDVIDMKARYNLDQVLQDSLPARMSLSQAEAVHGMPWKSSIDPKVTDEDLLYMPFWEWQMSFMKENLTNLRVMSCTNGKTDFSYKENTTKKARIVNVCASSDEYRKIRMTYYDAGDNCQVFNSVWYPDPKYNLPVLGIDLLAFNRKKYLAIVDFQPLHEDEADHATTYEDRLAPIKEGYDSLKGRMSSKFYDETQFFSQQMLFARFEDEGVVSKDLMPAFQSYVKTHLDLVRETTPKESDVDAVLQRQKAYDIYSADRDPATGLFCSMFGGDWAMDFVHDFLFSMSTRPEGGLPPAMPNFGGPPPGVQKAAPMGAPVQSAAAAQPVETRRR
jgi:15,16-dihydrobiliverdin:ferredoxin oxidoreductase